ncbi:hypothetical protein QYE76_048907 [Lolium multiflorum]|uniref:RNase H type-1 domain-containing protein n=1 Tax=Lolium multiflorum TaxID=4521 RepID=A0AAD8SLX5_LOLMU|nr:hypothetical protein QYE76_048907 [Lolium multiflorum]
MKLNPAKCTFGVPSGQLLGYLVSQRGSPTRRRSVPGEDGLPQCLRTSEVRGCTASLSRFVAGGEKAALYQLMKKADNSSSPQADEAFRDLKRVLSTAPILATPASMEPMLLYIAATNRVKVTYGVYMAAKKLKHYFQEHPIKILADFFVDWAEMQYLPPVPDSTHWKMHFDGSKMRNGLGAGIVITSPKGDRLDYVLQIHFAASNNVAEYEALIHGLKLAKEIGLSGFFDGCEFHHVPRANNEAADALSKIGSTRQAIPPGIALAVLKKPSIIPSPDSDSIFVPADPGAVQPNPGAQKPNPPAHMPNPGTSQSNPGASSPNSGASKPNPPASKPNPATMQSNPEAPTQEALLVSVFEIRCVPSWAQKFLSYLTDGVLP